MTVDIELTPEQEASLAAQAAREAKTVGEILVARAFPHVDEDVLAHSGASQKLDAWTELDRLRAARVTPPHLWDVKMDAEFFYQE